MRSSEWSADVCYTDLAVQVLTIDGDQVTVALSDGGHTLTLIVDTSDPKNVDLSGGIGVQLPTDDSNDLSANISVVTQEAHPEGGVEAEFSAPRTATINFDIEGVAGPAKPDLGSHAGNDGFQGGGQDGAVGVAEAGGA